MSRSDTRSHSTAIELGGSHGAGEVSNPIHRDSFADMMQSVVANFIPPPMFKNSVDDLAKRRKQNFEERLHCIEMVDSVKFNNFKRAVDSLNQKEKLSRGDDAHERFLNATIDDTGMISRNLPPLINKRYIDPRTVKILIYISEVGGILGSICFIVGSFYFYPEYDETMTFCEPYDCILVGSLLFVLGSFFFFLGSCANFVKNDAASCQDIGLTFNATLYCVANFLFTVGSAFFCPKLAHEHIPIGEKGFKAEYIGLGCFIFGSVDFILAPLYDIYRAHQLRNSLQISYLSMMVEFIIAVMYIGGSVMYLIGSVYFIPDLFERFAVTMFVVGSFCFLGACLSSPCANLYRYWQRMSLIRERKRKQKRKYSTVKEDHHVAGELF
mmetsp:Transcript_16460/g.27508  ORF Transcript_16460/g.27508 Transcript_16460/m.27508 type:complete len:383 (-) Transcript_16460:206-1354(-)